MFREFRYFVLSVSIVFTFIQCNNPRKVEIPQDVSSWESNPKFKSSIEKLKDDDKKSLLAYLMRVQLGSAFGGEGLKKGTTIEEAINYQKEWQAEQDKEEIKRQALAAEFQKKQLEAMKQMNEAVTVSLLNLSFHNSDYENGIYSDYFSIKIGFKNNVDKDISGVRGTIVLKDMFGEVIKRIGISNDNGIKASNTSTYSGTMNYNQFEDTDKKLRGTDFNKLKFEWEPDVYIYSDGSKIDMPQK